MVRPAAGRAARDFPKKKPPLLVALKMLAEWTGLEPATPGVTGRYSNQLNYHSMRLSRRFSALRKCHNNLMPLDSCHRQLSDSIFGPGSGRSQVDLRSERSDRFFSTLLLCPAQDFSTDRPAFPAAPILASQDAGATQPKLERPGPMRCASRAVPRSPEHHPHITHTSLKRPGWARCATRIAGVPQVRTFFGTVRAKDATVSHLRTRLCLHVDRIRGM